MILEVAVISCDHSNKEFVEGTSKPGTCTEKGYEGDYMCPDCGALIRGKNTPIDPENHDFIKFEVVKPAKKDYDDLRKDVEGLSGDDAPKIEATVRIVSNQNLLISKAKITFNPKSYAYTGKEITPSYKVTIGNATLEKGTDFTESIQNGIYPGTATLLIEAKPDNSKGYAGRKTATFRIVQRKVDYLGTVL